MPKAVFHLLKGDYSQSGMLQNTPVSVILMFKDSRYSYPSSHNLCKPTNAYKFKAFGLLTCYSSYTEWDSTSLAVELPPDAVGQ